jgi:putative acetyltransferase
VGVLERTLIRRETPQDIPAIRRVNEAAFDTSVEANIVDALRDRAAPIISLVAVVDDRIIGHIIFSPMTLQSDPALFVMALGPVAVMPDHQRRGIGSALVRAGLDECRRLGCAAIFLIGHAAYYPRFGFVPASRFGITSEYNVSDEVFLALELNEGALGEKEGIIRYHAAFGA